MNILENGKIVGRLVKDEIISTHPGLTELRRIVDDVGIPVMSESVVTKKGVEDKIRMISKGSTGFSELLKTYLQDNGYDVY